MNAKEATLFEQLLEQGKSNHALFMAATNQLNDAGKRTREHLSNDLKALFEQNKAQHDERLAMLDQDRAAYRRTGQPLFRVMVLRALVELAILVTLLVMLGK